MNNTKNISSSRILLIASVITIILLLVLSVIKISHIKETSSAINDCNLTLQNNKDRLKELEALKDNHSKLENEHKALINKIPASPDKQGLIDQVNQYSIKNEVKLVQVNFDEESEEEAFVEMPLKLKFEGKYISIMKLLEELDYGERLIRMDEIQIFNTDVFSNNVRAEISATGFYDK